MMEDQLPDRVRAAEQRREFRQLLIQSSIARLPKGFDEREGAIGSGMCQPCREDRCGDVECAIPAGCACNCTPDKEALASEIAALLDQRGIWRSDDDPMEMSKVLYAKGWRRES
jgi:hypothetical protein